MLVVQVRKRTAQKTQKVEVSGMKLLCPDALGPDPWARFFSEGDMSGPHKFFFGTMWRVGWRRGSLDELSLASLPAPKVLWCGTDKNLSLVKGILLSVKDRPGAAMLLTFIIQIVFFSVQGASLGGNASFPLLDLHSARELRMWPHRASQSCGMSTTDAGSGKLSLPSGILHRAFGFARQLSLFFETGVICKAKAAPSHLADASSKHQ